MSDAEARAKAEEWVANWDSCPSRADMADSLAALLRDAGAGTWTNAPSGVGWYWMRGMPPNPVQQIVYVGIGDDGLYYSGRRGFSLDGLCVPTAGVEWSGPLEPPR